MIDKTLLADMGFEKGSGWDHEVWVYDGAFWVHYGDYNICTEGMEDIVSGDTSMEDFFKLFIENRETAGFHEANSVVISGE